KLLDFGLAKHDVKLRQTDATLTAALTQEGQIAGTLQYMAPEQLEGGEIDARADLFAFGVVLYEMLSGKRPFQGATAANLIASVMKEQPPPILDLEPRLDRVLQTCLEKDPELRWQSAREIKHALQWTTPAAPQTAPADAKRWRIATGIATAAALGFAAWAVWPKPEPLAPVMRFEIAPPPDVGTSNGIVVSPDGQKIVVSAGTRSGVGPPSPGEQIEGGLWLRDLSATEWRLLPGTKNAFGPFWSPDSRFVGFSIGGSINKVDIAGGPPQKLGQLAHATGTGSWSRDGWIIFGELGGGGGTIWKLPQAGGEPVQVTVLDPDRKEAYHSLPVLLPGGRHFLYLRSGADEISGHYLGSLDAKPADQSKERIVAATLSPHWAAGHLLFMRDGTMMAQRFDEKELKLRGEPIPIAERVQTLGAAARFSASSSGTLAYRTGAVELTSQITWYDLQGKASGTFGEPGTSHDIVLSPDGTRAIVRDAPGSLRGDLWALELSQGVRTRLTANRKINSEAAWSADGSRIIFVTGEDTRLDSIQEKSSSGTGEEKELYKEPGANFRVTSWSRDGRFVLVCKRGSGIGTSHDLRILIMGDKPKLVPLLQSPFGELDAFFSPDMRWIAYSSNESGRFEVYVRPFAADKPGFGEGKWQVSRDGGSRPRWRSDGRELIFQRADGLTKMAVDMAPTGAALNIGIPRALFKSTAPGSWDVTGDGKRFLAAVPEARPAQQPITVVLNWTSLLKRN
ncbi:MAG: protein kinase domain-containing protein, partial [Bryobacteraceae bacterium]